MHDLALLSQRQLGPSGSSAPQRRVAALSLDLRGQFDSERGRPVSRRRGRSCWARPVHHRLSIWVRHAPSERARSATSARWSGSPSSWTWWGTSTGPAQVRAPRAGRRSARWYWRWRQRIDAVDQRREAAEQDLEVAPERDVGAECGLLGGMPARGSYQGAVNAGDGALEGRRRDVDPDRLRRARRRLPHAIERRSATRRTVRRWSSTGVST